MAPQKLGMCESTLGRSECWVKVLELQNSLLCQERSVVVGGLEYTKELFEEQRSLQAVTQVSYEESVSSVQEDLQQVAREAGEREGRHREKLSEKVREAVPRVEENKSLKMERELLKQQYREMEYALRVRVAENAFAKTEQEMERVKGENSLVVAETMA
jgi:ribosome-binding protein aMBF1 (putative translation factor)